ncbi:MAG: DNA repair protein RadC [Flavobacteriales bacterium]
MPENMNVTLKNWAPEDRPREKLMLHGESSLSDAELIAILLRTGSGKMDAVSIARTLMQQVDHDITKLDSLSVKAMAKMHGIGNVKAITIKAALALGKRRVVARPNEPVKIASSKDAYQILQPCMLGLKHEEFWIICLNRSHKVVHTSRLNIGGISSTVVDLKRIFQMALEQNASAIIVSHNHPSGALNPSAEDNQLTQRIKQNGELMECPLIDHLIVSDFGYFSYADEGQL